MQKTSFKHRGIALVQVLLLTAVLVLMMISVQQEARQQVKSAVQAKERAKAILELNSVEAELIFALLTERRRTKADAVNPIVRQWNFFNHPFTTGSATVAIEDVTTMVSVTSPVSFEKLVAKLTGDVQKAQMIVAALKDWQDIDDDTSFGGAEQADYLNLSIRNGPIQTESELRFLKHIDSELYCLLRPHITTAPRRYTNYFLMPAERQKFFVDLNNASKIAELRLAGNLTNDQFEMLSGIPFGEFQSYSASQTVRLSFTVMVNSVKLSRLLTLTINPNAAEPVKVWDYYKYYYADHENCPQSST